MQHTEIVISSAKIYVGPVGEAFSDIVDTPAGNWALLGAGGDVNLEEDGVTISHEQTLAPKRTLGSTGPVKVSRTEENMTISGILNDLTAEMYAKILNNVSVEDVAAGAGTGGVRTVHLRQGPTVSTLALMIKGINASPYSESLNIQYEIPVVYQSANPSPNFSKGGSANLEFEFTALEDENAASDAEKFGHYTAGDAAAS